MRKLITSLDALGIAKEDISSAQLQITPHYNWNNSAQIYAGTEVSRTVEITLRDLSRYDDLIRSIIDAGVAQIHSTRLSSSKEKKIKEDALRGAIQNGWESTNHGRPPTGTNRSRFFDSIANNGRTFLAGSVPEG